MITFYLCFFDMKILVSYARQSLLLFGFSLPGSSSVPSKVIYLWKQLTFYEMKAGDHTKFLFNKISKYYYLSMEFRLQNIRRNMLDILGCNERFLGWIYETFITWIYSKPIAEYLIKYYQINIIKGNIKPKDGKLHFGILKNYCRIEEGCLQCSIRIRQRAFTTYIRMQSSVYQRHYWG